MRLTLKAELKQWRQERQREASIKKARLKASNEASCSRKAKHETTEEAEEERDRLSRHLGVPLVVYECLSCHWLHVGRPDYVKRAMRRANA